MEKGRMDGREDRQVCGWMNGFMDGGGHSRHIALTQVHSDRLEKTTHLGLCSQSSGSIRACFPSG